LIFSGNSFAGYPAACRGEECMPRRGGYKGDRITNYLKLRFIADKPPPPQAAYQEFLMAAEAGAEYFL